MVKTIRISVIFSNTWKTHVWECLRARVYVCFLSCDVFWGSRRKIHLCTFLYLWIHIISGWKCSSVSRIVWKVYIVYKWIEVSFHWIFVPAYVGFETMWFRGSPYLNAQISQTSFSEEDVQSSQNLLKAYHTFYCSIVKNEQDEKVKHLDQF